MTLTTSPGKPNGERAKHGAINLSQGRSANIKVGQEYAGIAEFTLLPIIYGAKFTYEILREPEIQVHPDYLHNRTVI